MTMTSRRLNSSLNPQASTFIPQANNFYLNPQTLPFVPPQAPASISLNTLIYQNPAAQTTQPANPNRVSENQAFRWTEAFHVNERKLYDLQRELWQLHDVYYYEYTSRRYSHSYLTGRRAEIQRVFRQWQRERHRHEVHLQTCPWAR